MTKDIAALPPRDRDAARAVGVDAWSAASRSRILMVGAGGIGCELLKDLVMSGFRDIHIVSTLPIETPAQLLHGLAQIDLDTIDVSNLNRQFLFQKQHVNKSKAQVAAEAAKRFNPNVSIVSYHNSIFEPKFGVEWFRSFDLILNALDNIPARKHVNMMCRAANRPLIESGTAGYLGQVSVHLKVGSEISCFQLKAASENTIDAVDTSSLCCVGEKLSLQVDGVLLLMFTDPTSSLLFGKDDEEGGMTVSAEDNANEIEDLKREANELKEIKSKLESPDFGKLVFEKIFSRDVERLLKMSEMWENRTPPVPLNFSKLESEKTLLGSVSRGVDRNMNIWSVGENFSVFSESIAALARRLVQGEREHGDFSLSFDKDDDEALDFVTSVTNLRAHMYGIELQSRFKVKEMAGNIIPAISTTNAIIAGLIVMQAFKILEGQADKCKNSYLVHGGQRTQIICGETPQDPSPECATCHAGYLSLAVDVAQFTLGKFIEGVLKSELNFDGDITISEGGRLLYDPDFEDNSVETFETLGLTSGKRVMVLVDSLDNDDASFSVNFFVSHKIGTTAFSLSGDRVFPRMSKPEAKKRESEEEAEISNKKSKSADDGVEVLEDDIMIL
ncbi:E1 ubiquitin-activating protein uba2 [Entophlyctis luteolus]|nr:E1 ubiquitin-activating protein uba2 [Entophlyctis luteolus]